MFIFEKDIKSYFSRMSRILSWVLGLLVIALPLMVGGIGHGVFSRQEGVFWALIVCCVCLVVWAMVLAMHRREPGQVEFGQVAATPTTCIHLTFADLLVVAYFAVGLLNIAFVKGFAVDPMVLWRWAAMAAGYILVRALGEQRRIVLLALVVAGVVQAVVAIGQQIGWIASNHRMFDVTGTFGNPGQLGGFLAVAFVAAVALAFNSIKSANGRKWIARLSLAAALAMLVALWLADSRASYVAAAGGALILFWPWIVHFAKNHRKIAIPLVAALVIVAVAVGAMLFNHRPGSANARLLVWRVSADMIADKPIFGHGVGAFNEQYMLYQAQYFETHPDSRFVAVADNAAYPYNEFLHLLIEQGIVGLLLLLALLWAVFTHRSEHRGQRGLKAALIALLLFSMFSYPSYVFSLLFLFAVLIGSLKSKSVAIIRWHRWAAAVLGALLMAVAVGSLREMLFYREASMQIMGLFRDDNTEALGFIDENYDRLKHNFTFSGIYASWMAEQIEKKNSDSPMLTQKVPAALLERILALPPSCETWCDIGNAYAAQKNFDQAESYYRTASFMIPTRLTPNYLLWKLYIEQGDTSRAVEAARALLSQPLKVENTFTIRAKAEVKIWLDRETER